MENKSDIKGILLVVFIVISILLLGFVVYDKVLKKENCNCPKNDCQCEKCSKNDDLNNEVKLTLSSKYTNADDKKSYISFDIANGTWSFTRNNCHEYEDLSGTYSIKNNEIILKYVGTREGTEDVLKVIVDNSNHVEKIYGDDENNGYSFAGCSSSEYFVVE